MQVTRRLTPLFLRRLFSSFVVLALAAATIVFFVPGVVHAAGPTVTGKANNQGFTPNTISFTIAYTPGAAGDVVFVFIEWLTAPGFGGQNSISTVSDSIDGGLTQVYQFQVAQAGGWENAASYYSTSVSSTAARTETVTATAGTFGSTTSVQVVEVSGSGTAITCLANSGGFTAPLQTTTSCPFPTNGVAFAAYYANAGCCTAGASYTVYPGAANPAMEYSTSLTVGSTTNFPLTGGPPTVFSEIGFTLGPTVAVAQTQTVGSCPTKNTATFTPVNSTIYLYSGNALGFEVVNTVSTAVSSVVGSASQTFQLLLYVGSSASVSVANPLVLSYSRSFTLTAGTVKQVITAQVNVQLNAQVPVASGNSWAVGLVANDHLKINQSSLSGITTLAGNPSTAAQPGTFTSLGTSVGTQLYLCAVASYQSQISVVTTTTAAATTTATTTSTITSLDLSSAPFLLPNLLLLVIVIFGPMLILGGVTKSFYGAFFGALLGVGVGVLIGIIPFWFVVVAVLGMIMLILFARRGQV